MSSNDNNVEWNGLRHDTFDTNYRSPFGAVPTGTTVTIRFRTFRNDVTAVYFRVYAFDPPTGSTSGPTETQLTLTSNDSTYDYYTLAYQAPASPKIIYYKFRVVDGTDADYYSDSYVDDHDNLNQGGVGAASDNEPFPSFQLTVYSADFAVPEWIKTAKVYHIFPDRFRNGDITNDWCRNGSTTGCPSLYGGSPTENIAYTDWNTQICDPRDASPCPGKYGNQFYGGDLQGIEQKLDYLQSLGFNAIYLNPIFKARSNHRYDTDDYLNVADELGGNAAFASLAAAASARGMKLILDGVFNHMSQDSEYFDYFHRSATVGACESLSSTYRAWFNFYNTNVPCTTSDYEGWFGFSGLPIFNDNLPAVRDFFYRTPGTNVTEHWYDLGAGGWRFDVAPDLPHDWWHEYRGLAKTYKPDGVLIGENFPDASQYLAGDQLDGVMNYRFRKNVLGFARAANWTDNDNNGGNPIINLTPSQFDTAMRSIREDYPLPAQYAMLNLLDSHDTNRALYVLTRAGDTGLIEAKQRLKLAAAFQYTYIGAPMVYYGDEAGIDAPSLANNGNGQPEDDPYNRAPYPWADEAGDDGIYGPADQSMIAFYGLLASIRGSHPALTTGTFTTLLTGDTTASATDNSTYVFLRSDQNEKIVVALNNGSASNDVSIPVGTQFADGARLRDLLSSSYYTVSGGNIVLTIPARSSAILAAVSGAVPFDFDGDGKTDVSVFRPSPTSLLDNLAPEGSSSQWWILRSQTISALGITFGAPDDILVPSDFTGDGKADVAFFRPSDSTWYVLRSEDFTFYAFPFGGAGDIPAPGDFDGDGKADPAVYRPSAGTWFILRSSDGGVSAVPFGIPEDKPIVADYDADGNDDVAVYRPSVNQWWLLRSTAGVLGLQFGTSGDRSVIGDWTGDGGADVAFYRPATSEFFVIRSEDSSFFAFPWGAAGDIQAPGDYDGDGITDAAVYRPTLATWFINGSTSGFQAVQFGVNGDVPLPSSVSVQ